MKRRLQAGLIASCMLHVGVVLFLLLGLPSWTPKDDEAPLETTVAMVFQEPAQTSMKAPTPAEVPGPVQNEPPPASTGTEPPTPQPLETPPPPPPPPPPQAEVAPATSTPLPPAPPPTPSPEPAPVVPPSRPTLPALSPEPTPVVPTPPPMPPAVAPVVPPPPPAPPAPPAATTPPAKEQLPLPPPPAPPPPSTTSQPNPTTNQPPDSSAMDNTLEKLRQMLAQSQPPKSRSNPQAGGKPSTGGNLQGNDTATLTADQQGAIGDHVRECWTKDAGALEIDRQRVMLTVTTDEAGIVRRADVADDDKRRYDSDPRFRAFAERARRAVLNPHCANLPLPSTALGKRNVLTFRFTP